MSRSVQYVRGEVVVELPKTDKSDRINYLPSFAVQRLREIKGTGRLIGDLSPDAVARKYKAFCKKEKLTYVSLTNLRHTWATLAIESGADSATIAAMLGHSQINTTYEHYLVPEKKIYKDVQKGIEKLLVIA